MSGRCRGLVVVPVLCTLLVGASATTAHAAPPLTAPVQTCPVSAAPPPPVDASEVPKPGEPSPVPLPVPGVPVGGPRMAACGIVLPAGAAPPPAGITAASWVLADLDSGAVLAARDPHARHRPASLIKVLTALVALRSLKADATIVATAEDVNQEGSRVGLGAGGRYTVRQLLGGLLLNSGNDAAPALAGQWGGPQPAAAAMSALAARLGALDTRAAPPSGLDRPGMSTSAYDQALLFRVAMRDPIFTQTTAARLIDFPGWGGRPGFRVSNDNKLLAGYPGALGGKTGFTDDARHTYIGAAQRGDRRLVVVLLRGEQTPQPMWQQAGALLDYGFAFPAGAPAVGELVDSAPPPPAAQVALEQPADRLPYLVSAAAASVTALAILLIGLYRLPAAVRARREMR